MGAEVAEVNLVPVSTSCYGVSMENPSKAAAKLTLFDDRKILTVSQLTADIKRILEGSLGQVWLRGEISNLRIPASGHAYFTLKDENSQITAVIFRGRREALRFEMADGLEVIVGGRVTVYEPRGNYQILAEYLEPAGLGVLQAAFEKLKEKLEKEGLFDAERKRPLPFLPRRIGVVTSATGAAIRDILHVLARRNSRLSVVLAPAKVQGDGAAQEIAARIADLNAYSQDEAKKGRALDLIIVGRGGGSLEDLWAFNEEVVARAIFASHLPIVSAVGHEIDFTISDFVADLRAPTPSAAAEIVTPVLADLLAQVSELQSELHLAMDEALDFRRELLKGFSARLIRPDRRLADLRLRLGDWTERLAQTIAGNVRELRANAGQLREILTRTSPLQRIGEFRVQVKHLDETRQRAMERRLLLTRKHLELQMESLNALSPLGILKRGYAVARNLRTQQVLRQANAVKPGEAIEVILSEGSLQATVAQTQLAIGQEPPSAASKKSAKAAKKSESQGRLFS